MMLRVAGVQFHPWDSIYHFDIGSTDLKVGDRIIVRNDSGMEMGSIVSLSEVDPANLDTEMKGIVRSATPEDVRKADALSQKRSETLARARDKVVEHKLDMKLVDCFYSFDGGKLTLIFTADGRVDFRELVKDLAREFQKSIRLQQIGIRDEARRMGGMGNCGREVCCKKFLGQLSSVTTDMARVQQVHSRGSDRISGVCGRLMCCLAYESDFYEKESHKFPEPGRTVKTRQGKGEVISYNIVKKTVSVSMDGGITEVPLNEIKDV